MSKRIGELMEQAWSSMEELCSQLGPEDWDLPTACPGWSVKDQLAHVASLESRALGRPQPSEGPRKAPHVKNELGELNEGDLEARRSMSPEELLDEYRDVTRERGKVIASWSDEEWTEEGQGVLGKAPRDRIIRIRILDVFTHEQDIRAAVGQARPHERRRRAARLRADRGNARFRTRKKGASVGRPDGRLRGRPAGRDVRVRRHRRPREPSSSRSPPTPPRAYRWTGRRSSVSAPDA